MAGMEQDSQGTLMLAESVDIAAAAELHRELAALMAASTPITIDAARVEYVDAAGLQLLTAFTITVAARGGAVQWSAVSPAVEDGARLLGLEAHLGLPGDSGDHTEH